MPSLMGSREPVDGCAAFAPEGSDRAPEVRGASSLALPASAFAREFGRPDDVPDANSSETCGASGADDLEPDRSLVLPQATANRAKADSKAQRARPPVDFRPHVTPTSCAILTCR